MSTAAQGKQDLGGEAAVIREALISAGYVLDALEARLAEAAPTAETHDYLTRTIATVRNHRDSDNCWPQWANLLADEVERMWAALPPESETR